MNPYESKHIIDIAKRNKYIESVISDAIKDLAKRYTTVKGKRFSGVMVKRLEVLHDEIEKNINEGVRNQWTLANTMNNKTIAGYLSAIKISNRLYQSFRRPNLSALDAFLKRKEAGMNLSERVWNFTEGVQEEMERLIAQGVLEGKSAITLSNELKGYIKGRPIPYQGTLIPGRKLTYQAIRLAANELNMAFRASDYEQNSRLPFVSGVIVHLSPQHPHEDICDELAGEYPKGFVFSGWHPFCICYATYDTIPKEEFVKYIKTDELDTSQFTDSIPDKAQAFLDEHGKKLMSYKNPPYFLRDNFTQKMTLKKEIVKVK